VLAFNRPPRVESPAPATSFSRQRANYVREAFTKFSASDATLTSLFCIAIAIQISDGSRSRVALLFVSAALACLPFAVRNRKGRVSWPLAYLLLTWEVCALWFAQPCPGFEGGTTVFRAGILACGLAGGVAVLARNIRLRAAGLIAAAAGVFLLGVWILKTTPVPKIDTYNLHQDASAALYSGLNPYAIRIPDIYNSADSKLFYGPGISVNGRLTVGFPYPPVSLLLSSLGYLAAGDCRYAHMAAICAAALLLGFAHPSRLNFIAALALLFLPRNFFVVSMAWSEPVVVFLFAAVVFTRSRFPSIAPWVTGLALAGKQYLFLAVPILIRRWRDLMKAGFIVVLVTAPLALWSVSDFWRSIVELHLLQPFREDALSYTAALASRHIYLPGWLPFALAGAVAAIAWRKRTLSSSAQFAATALSLLLFFMFNKQAFCNYYFLIIALLACSLASVVDERSEPRDAGLVREQ
jgi:hypothetical protein